MRRRLVILGNTMASTVVPPLRTRRWTRLEYERLVELGVFQPGERLELIDGELLVRERQGSRHATAIRRVLAALRRALGDAWQIDSQLPLALGPDSEPEPDVAVVPGDPGTYRDAHPTRAVLIVEIAESSYGIDRDYKASLYARAGIADYW
ncbi:MAG: Uma2 family endonuclease, partial [Candidatus Rokuibacteriota bacterium]